MKKILGIIFCVILMAFKSADDKVTVFLIGDSTCANKAPADSPETGWGMVFPNYFNEAVQVQNHAVNGRSTKSFITEKRWDAVSQQLKKGDWVLIQFGHNDQKINDSTRYAAPQTTYRNNLIKFINETRAKGANPVLITPVMRRKFDSNGQFVDQHGEYPAVVKAVAKEFGVALIDLHAKSKAVIEQHGIEGSKKLFMHYIGGVFGKFPKGVTDDTHFSKYGASVMASLVAEGVVEANVGLKSFLKKSEFHEKYEFELPKYYTPVFKKDTFNIIRYGAKSNGITLNTEAINHAITICAESGGGTVLIPSGLWLTGPVVLKSNVNLHVAKGAILQFSRNIDDYPIIATTWEGEEAYRCQAPISGVDLIDIGLTGEGVIDGGGDVWRAIQKRKQTEPQWKKLIKSGGVLDEEQNTWYPNEQSRKGAKVVGGTKLTNGKTAKDYEDIKGFLRPNMLSLTRCKFILLENIHLQNSPAWTIHPLLCDHITMRNVDVKNYWYAQNSDGVDLESCRNGIMENCTFDTGDDGITIKSGRDEQGRKRGVPTENFIIKDCKVYHAHGGFVIGSEMSGGVRNMYVSNCSFLGTDVGLRFKTARGRGGIVENIYVNNIQMTEIVGDAVLFDMYYAKKDPIALNGESDELPEMDAQPLSEATPQFRDFYVTNINCLGAETGIKVRGLPEMSVKNVLIENAVLQVNTGLLCIEAENISLKNVTLITKDKTTMQVQNSKNISLDDIRYENAEVLLKISGERSQGIKLSNTNTSKAKKEVEFGKKVSKNIYSNYSNQK
ncbi:glycosyl hydrolase family 28 protein [Arcicella lustrica]|uniref:Glycosyl hydrolase family 28 protein n=1 Tax=Arcicella lustrica TaxID=2984196 RepID=A0ABU5SMN5_9BACT|nr:glycosyl hydrolase family 28 protein [Arcicella sp. DC25W]MEA5428568.1 glycosyl hydrolase family 28 protein [Arcicella sp. DC25W]